MALLDFLKRKKEIEKSKKPEKKSETPLPLKKYDKKEVKEMKEPQTSVSKKKFSEGFSYELIRQPHISEKASYLAEKNQYIFKVSPRSNKTEIKKSVEGIYHVDVTSVNVLKTPAKKRRLGAIEGLRKGYKKAIITIKEGQKIELL